MAQYKTGLVSATNGSAVITGVGTLWVGEVSVGDIFTIVGSNAWYEVGSVDSNTQITLTANYAGTTISDSSYTISRDFTANYGLPYPQKGDIETASLIKRAFQDIDSKLVLTSSEGDVTITGDLIVQGSTISLDTASVQTFTWGDGDKAIFGDGSDLQIYHNPALPGSLIEDVGSGDLIIKASNQIRFQDGSSNHYAIFNEGTSVDLYYNNALKLATTSTGIDVTGDTSTDTLSVSGNTTLGDASTDTVRVNGYMGVGGAASSDVGLYVTSLSLVGASQYGIWSAPVANSSATSLVVGALLTKNTAAASFTTSNAISLRIGNGVKGAGSTITSNTGIEVLDQTNGTNNYGITSLVSSGTNKWNIYASGTAQNYFAGNVGIGITTASEKLQVQGGVLINGTSSSINYTGLVLDYNTSTGEARVAAGGQSGANSFLTFTTTSGGTEAERARITSDGYVRLASGTGGIQFNGDTAAANALDDYEEGTFTPVLSDGAGNNATAAFSAGRYTKVGRIVTCQFYLININTTGLTAGNAVRISLPFTIYSSEYASSGIRVSRVTFSVLPVGYIANGAAFMNLNEAASGADGANILVSALTSGQADIMCAISYLTAS